MVICFKGEEHDPLMIELQRKANCQRFMAEEVKKKKKRKKSIINRAVKGIRNTRG